MLASLALPTAPEFAPQVGDLVCNFGQIARVIEVRPAPYNDLVVQEVGKRRRWIACPAKCQPVR
jgi:hypothetical protein